LLASIYILTDKAMSVLSGKLFGYLYCEIAAGFFSGIKRLEVPEDFGVTCGCWIVTRMGRRSSNWLP